MLSGLCRSGLQERGLGSKYKSGRSHLEVFSEGTRLNEIFEKGRGMVSGAPVEGVTSRHR